MDQHGKMSNPIQISFAIRHKPTGYLIPVAKGYRGRGGSHVEPCDPKIHRPKFFNSRASAKGWVTGWLKGKITVSTYQTYEGDWDEKWTVTPVPSRKAEELEIVEIYHVINET